ncbi:unnamed protein product [Microthlaspi erraticum]|uniref:J domain-containing protein n=1 Tax=Microthlaspi erraticum TaxID=1685480 RepID=A0A6D2L0T9_9BRAS|nr:unnamed protein product [Microthlaspi erraticum]
MESNKDEARKARDMAEKKISENDYVGAKRFVIRAQNLHPKLDGLEKISMTIHVLISASNKIKGGRGETDWYGVLGVDPSADEEAVTKQYRRLALLVHPDKNKFSGAEEAFKLINNALSALSDKVTRSAFDQSREAKQKNGWKKQKPSKPQEQDSSDEESVSRRKYEPKPREDHTFWTVCNVCKTYCMFERFNNLNKTLSCPNCSRGYVAKEIIPEKDVDGRPVFRFPPPYKREQDPSAESQERRERTSDASSSSSTSGSDSAKAANSSHEAEERPFKKPVKVDIFEE